MPGLRPLTTFHARPMGPVHTDAPLGLWRVWVCGGIGAMDGVRLAYTDVLAATPQTHTRRSRAVDSYAARLFA